MGLIHYDWVRSGLISGLIFGFLDPQGIQMDDASDLAFEALDDAPACSRLSNRAIFRNAS